LQRDVEKQRKLEKMGENIDIQDEVAFVNSIIGEGTKLKGEFELNGLLRIDGNFQGRVKTKGKVLVGKNGTAECEIIAGTIVIGGKVKGDIIATEKVTLLSTGQLEGSIKTPRLVIEEGVIFNGTCEIINDKNKLEKIKEEILNKEKDKKDKIEINSGKHDEYLNNKLYEKVPSKIANKS